MRKGCAVAQAEKQARTLNNICERRGNVTKRGGFFFPSPANSAIQVQPGLVIFWS